MSDLLKLTQDVRRCRECALRRKCKGPVPGIGKVGATIMAVDQAPGWEENNEGLPWIGQAGQFLSEILETLGFTSKDIYFTNLAKCFPGRITGGDAAPPAYAVQACEKWLSREIEVIQPSLILAVGAVCMKAFGITGGIRKDSGKVYESWYGIPVIPILHPAGLMRRMADTPIFTTQLNIIDTFLEGFQEPPDWVDIEVFDDARS